MSYSTLNHKVSIGFDTLLDLFLGRGKLLITKDGETIALNEIGDRHVLREIRGGELHSIKFRGVSDRPNVTHVDGTGTLKVLRNNHETCFLDLELHLQDAYD